jgi:hypothetical protein
MNILLYNKATKKLCTIAPAVERGRVLEGPGRDTGLGATSIMPIQILLRWGSHTTGPNQHCTKEGIFSVIRTIRLRSPYAGKEGGRQSQRKHEGESIYRHLCGRLSARISFPKAMAGDRPRSCENMDCDVVSIQYIDE